MGVDLANDTLFMKGCVSLSEFNNLLNITKAHEDLLTLKQNGVQDAHKMAETLLQLPIMIIGTFTTIAEYLRLSPWTLLISLIVLAYAFYKIILPFDYVQDLDIPGICYKRRDIVNLIRQMRRIGKKLPPPYPNGWYGVLESKQLKAGKVQQVENFGCSLAVFRGASGQVHAVDAHCPHLGANMAVGGTVKGECIECPFHKWQFSGPSGKCTSIPGVDAIPKNASVKTWEVCEVDEMIFIWYSTNGEGPTYAIPSVKEVANGEWKYMGRNDFIIPCHIQDIPENGADVAHLNALHQDHVVAGNSLPTSEGYNHIFGRHIWGGIWAPTKESHIAAVELTHDIRLFGDISMFNVGVTAKQIGPSYVQMEIRQKFATVMILQTVTPIAPYVQRVIHRLYAPMYMKPFGNLLIWAETVQFHRDVMVWASKEFVHQPLLVKTDRCLKAFRNWFKQFYTENSISFEDAMRRMNGGDSLEW